MKRALMKESKFRVKGLRQGKMNFPDGYLDQVQGDAILECWLSTISTKKSSLLNASTPFSSKHLWHQNDQNQDSETLST